MRLRSNWWLRWRDIPIGLHWTVLIGLPWFYYQTRSLQATAVAFGAFLFLLVVHELGHAAVAVWRHVEVKRVEFFFLHGLCAHEEPYDELDDVLIAWGGVAAQLAVLLVALAVDSLLPRFVQDVPWAVTALLGVLIGTNLWIIVLNLIPLAPFDGAKAWRALPLLRDWAAQTSWAEQLRKRSAARERARNKQLEAKSARITAQIIDKLKKGKSDA